MYMHMHMHVRISHAQPLRGGRCYINRHSLCARTVFVELGALLVELKHHREQEAIMYIVGEFYFWRSATCTRLPQAQISLFSCVCSWCSAVSLTSIPLSTVAVLFRGLRQGRQAGGRATHAEHPFTARIWQLVKKIYKIHTSPESFVSFLPGDLLDGDCVLLH